MPLEGVLGVLPDVLPVFVLLPRQEEPLVAMLMGLLLLLDYYWPQGSWLDLWSPTTVEIVELGAG